jgi:aspartyl-tRNA(Asn)/glutamyl-tRNA(Gln) amidotransferase subunit A
VQSSLNAFITLDGEHAIDNAKASTSRLRRGQPVRLLEGVPISVKDLLNTAGLKTTFGSLAFENNVPPEDCVAVSRLKAAGAIVIGKSTTPEFGHKPLTEAPLFGRTRNPWDQSRTCGGSSGGGAAAVAAGAGPIALGTDGGGSIRIPAAACGIVGVKQTLGVVPHDQTPDSFGLLAYIGPMARNVDDAARMLAAMAGAHRSDPHTLGRQLETAALLDLQPQPLAGLRVGFRARLGNESVGHEVLTQFESVLAELEALGSQLVSIDDPFPSTLEVWGPLTFSIWAARFGSIEAQLGDRMSSSLRHWMQEAGQVSAIEVQQAMAVRTDLYRQVSGWFEGIDVLLTPTLSRDAIALDHDVLEPITIDNVTTTGLRDGWYPYTHPFNLTGHPAVTIPLGWSSSGLPHGLQLVGPWLDDVRLCAIAKSLEAVIDFPGRWPDLESHHAHR